MELKGDYVSIAATTAGVTGTISVPKGAHLVGLNVAMKTADGGIISSIEVIAPTFPQPLKFTPVHFFGTIATNMHGMSISGTPLIPLDIMNKGGTTVTIKVTTTANETVVVGLMWVE